MQLSQPFAIACSFETPDDVSPSQCVVASPRALDALHLTLSRRHMADLCHLKKNLIERGQFNLCTKKYILAYVFHSTGAH